MRELYTARLERKLLLSAAAECYHLEFRSVDGKALVTTPGQFFSLVAEDRSGKTYTRAYSLASAAGGPNFDLCVNRVPGGFFSNLLCDLGEGDTIRYHGPHGLFTLKEPLVDALMVAGGTGIAPFRSFVQRLFGGAGSNESADLHERRQLWLIHEAPEEGQFFYGSYFRDLTALHANFHYVPLLNPEGTREVMHHTLAAVPLRGVEEGGRPVAEPGFDRYAYVCGLADMVKPARAYLMGLGWERQQVLFERYD